MRVIVRFFATLRDRAGTDAAPIELPDPSTVSTLVDALASRFPSLDTALPTALVAVNQEYAFPTDELRDGDEVALFPPVSGGTGESANWPEHFAVTHDALDLDSIAAAITRPQTGALAIFTGAVRGVTQQAEGQLETAYLDYEAYEPMAEKTLRQVAAEIRQRFPKVQGIAIVQRIGQLSVGETTVLVACAAGHRHDGIFEAAHYGIDRLKEIVPVWKKEVGRDSSLWVEGHYHPTPQDVPGRVPHTKSGESSFALICVSCGERYALDANRYRCTCSGCLKITGTPSFDDHRIDATIPSLWRYQSLLVPEGTKPVTMGEGWTPLVELQDGDRCVCLKMEGLNPTGSFKDRGASLLISILKAHGIAQVHDDSSGNAGAALAAYAARAGLRAKLYVPTAASPVKVAQIALYGAQLELVAGPRSGAADAAEQAAQAGESYYASHVYHPIAVMAYKSLAYELWEQLGRRVPDIIILPVGHGTQLLGLSWGMADLKAAGVAPHSPRLIGVQARQCAPLWQRFHDIRATSSEDGTLAEGICIANPVRGDEVLDAVRASGGDIVAIEESDIRRSLLELAQRGISVEPSSAVTWAAYQQIEPSLPRNTQVVLSMTGSGLKTPQVETLLAQPMRTSTD